MRASFLWERWVGGWVDGWVGGWARDEVSSSLLRLCIDPLFPPLPTHEEKTYRNLDMAPPLLLLLELDRLALRGPICA